CGPRARAGASGGWERTPAPAAIDPFNPATTSLKLSNVPNAIRRTLPPLGAFGLTLSKCLKPAGYLSSPNSDNPCFQSSACSCARAEAPRNGAPNRSRIGDKAARTPVRTTDRRVRRKETSAGTTPMTHALAGLCPILGGWARTCARSDHHFAITL